MPTLLQIDSSPLSGSVSRELTREYARTWQAAHPDGRVLYRDLAAHAPQPIDEEWITAAYTAPGSLTEAQAAKLALSDELIEELEIADEYVIGVAMHNFSIPSVLKLWVDQIARRGKTFTYGEGGPSGLLKGKKASLLVASGGFYAQGSPAAPMNHADPYLAALLNFLGVKDVKVIATGGTASLLSAKVDRGTFLQPAIEQVRSAAA